MKWLSGILIVATLLASVPAEAHHRHNVCHWHHHHRVCHWAR